jgi:DNA primase catalytic core
MYSNTWYNRSSYLFARLFAAKSLRRSRERSLDMARIPEHELQRLKEEVSVQRLVEASGVELKKAGKDWLGRCPFHDDAEASLVVSPAKNLWHCFGCQIGGGPIDWVIKHRGVSFRHAVELLKADPSLAAGAASLKRTTVRALPAPVALDADDQALLAQTIDYYHQRLKESPEALEYLKARGLDHPQFVDTFKLGVADRTLGLRLPEKNRKDGAAIRERLQRIGILRDSGHEHFNGSLVVPVFDASGNVVEVYGRKLLDNLRPGTPKHLYLPGPHAGVFNLAGVIEAGQRTTGEREVILCEALIDAMTFWCAGYTNVTSAYGVEGFGEDIVQCFKANAIERVLIAYDRDDAGERAADKLGAQLIAEGFECLRVVFPQGMDANEYARKMSPADKALALVLRQAQWIGSGRKAEPAAEEKTLAPTPQPPASAAEAARPAPAITELPEELHIDAGACTWRVRGWKKNASPEAMRVNVQVCRKGEQAGYHMDTLDLYAARGRAAFVRQASIELGMGEDALKRELGAVLLKLEALQDELLTQARERVNTAKAPVLSADEETQALELLRAPNLTERIVADLHALGVVGEDTNLLVAYLAAVSRKLEAPLAVLIQSSSAAGKSSLMDAVLQLVPEEERIRYSAMTGQSLFYLGETNLQHKILAIAEEEGVRQAAYALKLLQSDGELTIASTAKDESTGNLTTKQYTVKGPVMLMLTTTAIDVDEELLNRCLVLSVNESREQTAAIHARQRHKQTLQGLLQRSEREGICTLHHNAQRLLANVAVVNPYADRLTFLADKTRTRRDHMKYLTLIQAIALLHQHQREVKTVQHKGQTLAYIEATKADIELANAIAHEVLGRTLDELPPQTRKLLHLIHAMVLERAQAQRIACAQVRFTRRDVRQATQWSDNQLKVHCARLADMEYLLIHGGSRGHSLGYELLWDGDEDTSGRRLCGLIDPAELDGHDYDDRKLDRERRKLPPSWPQVGAKLDPADWSQSRANAGAAADARVNGAPMHIKTPDTSSSVAVVAAGR